MSKQQCPDCTEDMEICSPTQEPGKWWWWCESCNLYGDVVTAEEHDRYFTSFDVAIVTRCLRAACLIHSAKGNI